MPVGQLLIVSAVAAVLLVLVGAYAPAAFLSHFTVFVLACFVGYMVEGGGTGTAGMLLVAGKARQGKGRVRRTDGRTRGCGT
jgi:hypothetical protein